MNKSTKKERTCRLVMSKPHFGYVVKCTICGAHHVTKLYKRCPGCGRLVEDFPADKDARKAFDRARSEFFRGFQKMMLETDCAQMVRGGSGRRERRTINAGHR